MTTLLDIRTRAKAESDNANSGFVSDPDWNSFLNASYQEAYGLYAQVYQNYFVQSPATGYLFSTNGVDYLYSLPADCWKLLGVDVNYGNANQWVALRNFPIADRNKFSAINSPIPAAGQQLRVFYIPSAAPLVNDGDILVPGITLNGGEEYVVADACIKAMAKEEDDVSIFMARKQALTDRLNAEADNRDAGLAAHIVDLRGRGSAGMQYALWGSQLWLIGYNARGWPGGDWDVEGYGGGDWW